MFMDIIFLTILIGFLLLGFYQGVIRLAVLLVAYYLSVVLASVLFQPLGMFFLDKFGTHPNVGFYVAFAIILLLSLGFLATYGLYSVRDFHMPGHLMYVDKTAGVFIALILAALFMGMFAVLMWNLFVIKGAENIKLPIMHMLGGSVRSSFLLNYFAVHILPMAYNFADPILPAGARIIFAVGN
jgi:membrane protein required for colicin V production